MVSPAHVVYWRGTDLGYFCLKFRSKFCNSATVASCTIHVCTAVILQGPVEVYCIMSKCFGFSSKSAINSQCAVWWSAYGRMPSLQFPFIPLNAGAMVTEGLSPYSMWGGSACHIQFPSRLPYTFWHPPQHDFSLESLVPG